MINGKHHGLLSFQHIIVVITAVLMSVAIIYFAINFEQHTVAEHQAEQRLVVLDQLSAIRAELEGDVNGSMSLLRGVASYISQNPNATQEEFSSFSSSLIDEYPHIRNIGAAPNFVIRLMYPLKGNEKAVGLDYRKTPAQWEAAKRAMDTRKMSLAGPLNLVQGGKGLIGRVPVFEDGIDGPFWGLVSGVIDVQELYENAGLSSSDFLLNLKIQGKDGSGRKGEYFYGKKTQLDTNPIKLNVNVPNGEWVLLATPKGGWLTSHPDSRLYLFTTTSAVVMLLSLAFLVILNSLRKQKDEAETKKINEELLERTAALTAEATKRQLTEIALMKSKEEAEKANRSKSEFLASMSHELRTPLNAVLGFAQMLQFDPKNPLSKAQNLHVESILEGGDHLLELVNQILDLASIEADQVSLSLGKVNAVEVIEDCLNLMSPLGNSRDIQIINNISDKNLPYLRTDQTRFKQCLVNLLSNAVKYNMDGGTVTLSCQEIDEGYLRISVTDTGIGIAKDDYSGVFQIFNRLGADPMITKEGTGIGLPVTKMLVELLSGRVGFESEEGVGSTFWLELPLASNEDVLIWADNLRVGVDAIDKDHQKLIFLTNQLSYEDIGEDELNDVLSELVNYAKYHFTREETIMEICGYPDLEKHRALHSDLAANINEMADQWHEERKLELLINLRKFMRDWLIDHVMKVDKEIAKYTKGKSQEITTALGMSRFTPPPELIDKP